MLTHNPADVLDVIILDEIDVYDVDIDAIDAPEDYDSAAFTFDPFVV